MESTGDSTVVESKVTDEERPLAEALEKFHYLPRGLKRLGYTKNEAKRVVTDAIRVLVAEGAELTDQEIIQQALIPGGRKKKPTSMRQKLSSQTP